jgi:adenylate kinase
LVASDEFLFKRVRNLPEENIAGTHLEEDGMIRRLEQYRKLNDTSKGFPILLTFFAEHKLAVLNVNVEMTKADIFNTLRSFVDKVFKKESSA